MIINYSSAPNILKQIEMIKTKKYKDIRHARWGTEYIVNDQFKFWMKKIEEMTKFTINVKETVDNINGKIRQLNGFGDIDQTNVDSAIQLLKYIAHNSLEVGQAYPMKNEGSTKALRIAEMAAQDLSTMLTYQNNYFDLKRRVDFFNQDPTFENRNAIEVAIYNFPRVNLIDLLNQTEDKKIRTPIKEKYVTNVFEYGLIPETSFSVDDFVIPAQHVTFN